MISERTSKRHGIRYLVRVDYQGRKATVGTYRTLREAKTAERRARNDIERGAFKPTRRGEFKADPEAPRILTVADALDGWLADRQRDLAPNTIALYESAPRLHVIPALGAFDVTGLTYTQIRNQVTKWNAAGMGTQLRNRCVDMLSAALSALVEHGDLPRNPALGIKKGSARPKQPFTGWDDDQIAAFLTEAERDERYAPFWFLTAMEGFRRAEALGLRWCDLRWNADETQCTATIVQTVIADLTRGGAAKIQPYAKTRKSSRTVLLTAPTIGVLKAHRDRQRFDRQRHADLWPDHDLIVTTSIGTPVTPSTIKRNLHALIERAGVPQITIHGLRHQAATTMLRANISPVLVSSKLGHANISTTVDIYGHLIAADQSAPNAALESKYRAAAGK